MKKQMEIFKENLTKFASEHKEEINKNPVFRHQFTQMCQSIGVDPLACTKIFIFTVMNYHHFHSWLDLCFFSLDTHSHERLLGKPARHR
jgi:ESCRT-II complex subunit VPS22